MAKYTSRYPELMFYVDGELKRFSNGKYNTDDKAEIAVLDGLLDAKRVDEKPEQPKQSALKAETKTESKPEAKPATKSPAKRTASAK